MAEQSITKPIFSPFSPDFSREILEKNPVHFPSGNLAGRAGPHWNLPGSAVAHIMMVGGP
jgi:hypothetical protein